jgi:hypothetical protein
MFNVVDLSEIAILMMHHMQNKEFANAGTVVGGGFGNTKELRVMNYKEAVNGPDGVCWRAEVENEHQQMLTYQQMLTNKVLKAVLQKDLPSRTKLIDGIWVMKKMRNSTLNGQMNARGFKQVEGQH